MPEDASGPSNVLLWEPDPAGVTDGALEIDPSSRTNPDELEANLLHAQSQMDGLRAELNLLRRQDEALQFHMHRLDEELRLAARLQQDFLPKSLPQLGSVHFHTLFRPAGYVSGDLYDVVRLDEKTVGFYIADAVGHGMPAALLTMFLKQALVTKQITPEGYRLVQPSQTLRGLNLALLSQNLTHATFATAIYGVIDVETRRVTLARAGHPFPLILRADGTLKQIDSEGGLLGVFEDETYPDCSFDLEEGDRLVIFTDGVELGFGNTPPVDDTQWRNELQDRHHLGGEKLVKGLAERLDQHGGSLDPKDDLTVIVIEVCPRPSAEP